MTGRIFHGLSHSNVALAAFFDGLSDSKVALAASLMDCQIQMLCRLHQI